MFRTRLSFRKQPRANGRPKRHCTDTAALRKMADDYYGWRNENYPVQSSDAGLHTWDNRLTDYTPAKISRAGRARERTARKSARDED